MTASRCNGVAWSEVGGMEQSGVEWQEQIRYEQADAAAQLSSLHASMLPSRYAHKDSMTGTLHIGDCC